MHKNAPFCTDACKTLVDYTPVSMHPIESFGPRRAPGRGLSEFLSASYVCKSNLHKFLAELTEFALPKQCSRNSIFIDLLMGLLEGPFSAMAGVP